MGQDGRSFERRLALGLMRRNHTAPADGEQSGHVRRSNTERIWLCLEQRRCEAIEVPKTLYQGSAEVGKTTSHERISERSQVIKSAQELVAGENVCHSGTYF